MPLYLITVKLRRSARVETVREYPDRDLEKVVTIYLLDHGEVKKIPNFLFLFYFKSYFPVGF